MELVLSILIALSCIILVIGGGIAQEKRTPGAECRHVASCQDCAKIQYCYWFVPHSQCISADHIPNEFDVNAFTKNCAMASQQDDGPSNDVESPQRIQVANSRSTFIEAEAVQRKSTDKSGWFEPPYNEVPQAAPVPKPTKHQLHLVTEFKDGKRTANDDTSFYYDEHGNPIETQSQTSAAAAATETNNAEPETVDAVGLQSQSDELSNNLEASTEPVQDKEETIALEQSSQAKVHHAKSKQKHESAQRQKHASGSSSSSVESRLDSMEGQLKRIETMLRKRVK